MSLDRRDALGVVLRLGCWLPLLFWLAWTWGWHYADFFLPLYRAVLDGVLPDFGVVYLGIGLTHEYVFKAQVIAERMILEEGRLLPSGFTVDSLTPMYIALVHPIILAAAALAWPGLDWKGRASRLALSLPFLPLLEALDTPLVLASSVRDLLSYGVDPEADDASKLLDWVHVMDGGGRYALCLGAVLATAGLHAWIVEQWGARADTRNGSPKPI
jgi:hypothetical protein